MKILPVYYFPPVAWFAAAAQEQHVVLEQWIHYRKQNFYNRTCVKTPDKTLNLTIPIQKAADNTPLHQREISYDWHWQHDHWKSLESAYRRSPYFEYYENEIQSFFTIKESKLLDFNLKALQSICRILGMELEWKLSDAYEASAHYSQDLRHAFPTKTEELPQQFIPQPYLQVFGSTFTPNLSILDLLFNKGPESLGLLKASWVDHR